MRHDTPYHALSCATPNSNVMRLFVTVKSRLTPWHALACTMGCLLEHCFTLTRHDKVRRKMALIDFVIIWHQTEHNIILGRTTLFRFGTIWSTIHGIVKFDTTEGPRTILATPPQELRCCEIMQPKEITKEARKPQSVLPNSRVVINAEYLDQPVSIGINLSPVTRQELINLLRKFKHVSLRRLHTW